MSKHSLNNKGKREKGTSLVWISVIYLLGLFIGAIDTGIITPARPIIQNELGVDASLGIWMITIYTLTYAAIIPISGKLADRKGRKPVYLLSVTLFGLGSVICALSAVLDSFLVLMIGRIVQASGAGGIMPVATAEFGTSFPEEKRGMALGLVGAVYGIANVLGASVGSAVLDIVGTSQWQWIFLINVPICLFIVIAGIIALPNNRADEIKATDKLGTLLMTVIILSLLYGLKNLDFFDFIASFTTTKVWPFIALSVILIPLFVAVERKAEDPIFHIEYAGNRPIMITLALAVIVGCSMMGMVFIPQFAENALKIPAGSGGYFVVILGFCAGGSSMMSGKLIDRRGAKIVMAAGFIVTIIGCLYLSFIAVRFVNLFNVIVSLVLIGFGLGLTMGTPLNYMMLQHTSDEESNSALATLSLVRSIGTAVAPAIMVGFIVHAAVGLQGGIMEVLPKQVEFASLPHAEEIDNAFERFKNDPNFADRFEGMDIPRLSEMTSMEINMEGDGDFEMPSELLQQLQDSDVTNISENTQALVRGIFAEMTPKIINNIDGGLDQGINGIETGISEMEKALSEMGEGYDGIGKGISGMSSAVSAQDSAIAQLRQAENMLRSFKNGIPEGMSMLNFIPDEVKSSMPQESLAMLEKVRTADDLKKLISQLDSASQSMKSAEAQIDSAISMMERLPDGRTPEGKTLLDYIPAQAQTNMPADVLRMLSGVTDVKQLYDMRKQLEDGIKAQTAAKAQLEQALSMLTALSEGKIPEGMSLLDFIPDNVKSAMPADTLKKLGAVKSVDDLAKLRAELENARNTVSRKLSDAKQSQSDMKSAMDEMRDTAEQLKGLLARLIELRDAVPDAVNAAGESYISGVEKLSPEIERVFQSTLNEGYRNMYLFLVAVNAVGLLLLMFYREPKRTEQNA